MGCSFSCKKLTSPSNKFNNIIRVVHLNGQIEHINYPVTVAEVAGNPPNHFVFTHANLLSPASKPLKLDARLEPGRLYFLLPFSLFQSNMSPVDLAPLARKLTSTALNSRFEDSKSGKRKNLSLSCNRAETGDGEISCGKHEFSKPRLWKPILDTIRERSFNRRSESDLQEA